MTMTPESPQFIGFENGAPMRPAKRVAELLRAARAAIVPQAKPTPGSNGEAGGEEQQSATRQPGSQLPKVAPERVSDEVARIAQALRSDDGFDRFALAAALDALRDALASSEADREVLRP